MASNGFLALKRTYANTIAKMTSSLDSWFDFLMFASTHTDIPFLNQVVVYAAKPDAGQVLPLKQWNEGHSRFVHRGSKGIRVFDMDNPGRHTHYFDAADTQDGFFAAPITDWSLIDGEHDGAASMLRAEFGVLDVLGFEDAIAEAVDELLPAALKEYASRATDSDVEAVRHALRASAIAVCFRRCGLDFRDYFSISDFAGFIGALDARSIGAVGAALNKLCASLLEPIEAYIRALQIERGIERGVILETQKGATYNEDSGEPLLPNNSKGDEHHDNDENNLGIAAGRVREGATEVPARGEAGDVSGNVSGRDVGGSSDGSAEPSRRDASRAASEDDRAAGSESEGNGFPDVRGASGQRSQSGSRDSVGGSGLSIEKDGVGSSEPASLFDFSEDSEPADGANAYLSAQVEALAPAGAPHDFNLRDTEEWSVGGPKERFRANVAAIKLLREFEESGRTATPEEQVVLARYVGWGGLSDAFDPNKEAWSSEYAELTELLSESEYRAARESTLTSFYTPNEIVSAMYTALGNMGFEGGRVLDPSCGTGRFIGMIPPEMQSSTVYGIEPDVISAKIAQQLYQTRNISIRGFEDASFDNGSFDVAITNVPFGQFKLNDPKYNKHNFLIHDYFFAKALDMVRPGGVIAFITSKGTLDKENSDVRRYIAQRAELLGAVRLPDNAFKSEAGTEVTSDIVFLQKRDHFVEDPQDDWVHLGERDGITMNQYFVDNPDMVLGDMVVEMTRFGPDSACKARESESLTESLSNAINMFGGVYESVDVVLEQEVDDGSVIPALPGVRNFSYAIVDGAAYYRENEFMKRQNVSPSDLRRIEGMCAIRDAMRELIFIEVHDSDDSVASEARQKLNAVYDAFVAKNGVVNDKANEKAFKADSSYYLIASLEDQQKDGSFTKAAIFSKRTINPVAREIDVQTAQDALAVCIGDRAVVDLPYMSSLSGISEEALAAELEGDIYQLPESGRWVTADEYLSGDVREKLATAQKAVEEGHEEFAINVAALEAVLPEDIPAHEITVNLGAVWIPVNEVRSFIYELLETPYYNRATATHTWGRSEEIDVLYSPATASWALTNKARDKSNVRANSTYGTKAKSAYELIEDALNQKDAIVYKTVYDPHSYEKKRIVDQKETVLAQSKQEEIRAKFRDWVFSDPARRERLVRIYNDRFNSIVPRHYDGGNLKFVGMSSEVQLKEHQVNAVARQLYGGNTLLYHVVGSGKSFTMAAASQEGKRLGLHNKAMFVVPNHLTEQMGNEYLRLYPNANILVATKSDFETANRKRFCSRIATGDWDAVIIGHSQFEKIPMSLEYQKASLEAQLKTIMDGLTALKDSRGDRWSIKEYERSHKSLETRIAKLNTQERKDDVVTFEELGVDRLFVDEAHYYKNLFLYTKQRNIAGIQTTEAQKSSDMFMKARYLDEKTGGRGVTFATGTAVSNSMVELYTMQRYLQYGMLEKADLEMFDSWAATFGEQMTAIELSPDGKGYRAKTRFAKFHNLPELMTMFREVADVQTADMLSLPVPEAQVENVKCTPSEHQRMLVEYLGERADNIRAGSVNPSIDNMLCVTNDGRKLALDQRLIDPDLPDDPASKVSVAAEKTYEIWEEGKADRTTQLVFCDISTPGGTGDGRFSVYEDFKAKLIARGVPEDEIAFIHDAKNEKQRESLFEDVRQGNVRILLGSTFKMGAGTNVQDRLVAIHNLDCPWRPADLEQRAGRIVRQGNMNDKVRIFRYVTEGTFDSYLYQTVENKQRFISQVFTSADPSRSAEDIDEAVLDYAEVKALASGNPLIKEKMELDSRVPKLRMLKGSHKGQLFDLETKLNITWPQRMRYLKGRISALEQDIDTVAENPAAGDEFVGMTVGDVFYDSRTEAGEALTKAAKAESSAVDYVEVGSYRGFRLLAHVGYSKGSLLKRPIVLVAQGVGRHEVVLGDSGFGNVARLNNLLENLDREREACQRELDGIPAMMEEARKQIAAPFAQQQELDEAEARLAELNAILNLDKRDIVAIGDEKDMESEESGALEFDRQQTIQINKGIAAGLSPEAMALFGRPDMSEYRMATIREELEQGTDPAVFAKYVDSPENFDRAQLREIAAGIRAGVNVDVYAKRGFGSYNEMRPYREALEAGINVERYMAMGLEPRSFDLIRRAKDWSDVDLCPFVERGITYRDLYDVYEDLKNGIQREVPNSGLDAQVSEAEFAASALRDQHRDGSSHDCEQFPEK